MPTSDRLESFLRDYEKLTPAQRAASRVAVGHFVADLKTSSGPRSGLRVKKMRGRAGIWELTWADDGRATFEYGPGPTPGEMHVVWRRIGTHDVFKRP
jgi:hypothetical protein